MENQDVSGRHVSVHAVIVSFLPEIRALSELMGMLSPQVDRIHVIDNSPPADTAIVSFLENLEDPKIALIRLGGNHGIAKALNVGIGNARDNEATHVLLSDQDSLPASDMVANLLKALDQIPGDVGRVGAVGPTFTDQYTGITFPFQAEVPGKFFYSHVRPDNCTPMVEALTLITSGCLIPMEVLDDVGGMREDFFIDQVDIEWCHRARARGWHLYGTCLATMSHSMGDADLRVWYFGWRRETAYPPLRLYYRVRNFIALCKMR